MSESLSAVRLIIASFFLLLLSSHALSVETEMSAEQVLSRLSQSMREQNYQGVVTYEHGGRLETMQATHLVLDGVEFESYSHLNGPERQHARMGRLVSCQTLGGQLLSGGKFAAGSAIARFHDHYQFYVKGYDRVAGRKVVVMQILPKDNFRYGISLGVDVESGVLLKYLVMQPNRALERIQFVAFELNPTFSPDEIASITANANGLQPCAEPEPQAEVPEALSEWMPSWAPPGFVHVSSKRTEQDGIVHTYTDGLASYSVFINSEVVASDDESARIPQGAAQRGATLVVMSLQASGEKVVHVAVVGEVPQVTAAQVLKSVSLTKTATN
ncbi:MucB/RseB C-terminal domain-containing protein [Teredinibacter turnerae]|uniref:MucB/RseB C-terminal domain-containing protein n=1 Tax=Teredinibacter turnerae TaxID=2426 RepID=UPI0030CBDC8E